jgi:multiple sugar transport system substrate-binding protein
MSIRRLSRREFLTAAAGALGAGVLASCAPEVIKETVTVKETVIVEGESVEVTRIVEGETVKETVVVEVEVEAPPPEPFEIVVSAHWPLEETGGYAGVYREFVRLHPEVTVVAQEVPYGEAVVKRLTQVAAGVAPDAITIDPPWFLPFYENGVLEALDPYMEAFGVSKDEYFEIPIMEFSFDGMLYGIPNDMQPECCIFTNEALFAEAGVDQLGSGPDATDTWDDLRALTLALTKFDDAGKATQHGLTNSDHYGDLLMSYAGGYVDDVDNPTKCVMGTDEAIQGVQLRLDQIYEDLSVPGPQMVDDLGTNTASLFGGGLVSMTGPTAWAAIVLFADNTWAEVEVSAFLGPTGPTGIRGYELSETSFGVTTTSEHPQAAAEFILLLNGEVGWGLAMEEADGNIFAPAHKGAFAAWEQYPGGPAKDRRRINLVGNDFAVHWPRFDGWAEIRDKYIRPDMDLVVRQELPVAETMRAIAETVDAELAK